MLEDAAASYICEVWRFRSPKRLHHTMASNLALAGADLATVMAAGGWVNTESMAGYVAIPEERARRWYEEAMKSCREK